MAGKVIDPVVLKRAVARSTRASARLERRVVPAEYIRSKRVQEFLTTRSKRS